MQDPHEEYWEVEDDSHSYESNGKLRWIWRKGLSLGKKIIVTGALLSSAPVVLPPLVVISAFGFVFNLPAGFAYVTYACTEKLMKSLLPMPSQPRLLEHGKFFSDEEEYMVDGDDVDKGYSEDEAIEAEEEEFEEDIRKGVEMRIELIDEDNNKIDDYDQIPVNKDEVDRRMKVDEIVEKEGYEEDVGDYMEDEEQPLNSNAIPEILDGIREAEDEISSKERERDEMPIDSLRAVVVAAEVGGEDEDNVEQVLEELAFVEEPRNMKEEEKEPMDTFNDINEKEMRRGTTELIEEMGDESKDNQKRQENERKGEIPIKDMTQNKGNKNLSVIPEEVKLVEGVTGVINGPSTRETNQELGEGEPKEDESVIMQAEPKPVVEKKLVVHVKKSSDQTTTDVRQVTGLDRKRGTLVLPNADAREMADESGLDLFDHETLESDQISESINIRSKGEEPASENVVDFHGVSVDLTTPVPERAKARLDQVTTASSAKVSVNEEKIWEKIHAMRTVVGYRDAPRSSCVEELNVLYVFTGVEPLVSSKDPTDLVDINEKLHFLMSVIGVK